MKKRLFVFMSIILLLIIAVGCSSNDQADSSSNTGEQTDKQDNKKESGNDEVITIVLGHAAVEEHSLHKGYVKFKELVEEKTNGQIQVNINSGGALGGDRELAESVELGSIQMALNGTTTLESYDPKLGALALPYLFDGYDDVESFIESEIGKSLMDVLGDSNIRILAFPENGFRHISNNKHSIQTVEDLQGLKIRAMETPIHVATFEKLGMAPTPIPFPEIYSSLQSKLIDAQENTMSQIQKAKYYEVQPYVTFPGPFYLLNTTIINENFFQSLSEEHQQIIQESAIEAAEFQRNLNREEDEAAIEYLKEEGIEIVEFPEEEVAKLKEMTYEIYEQFKDEIGVDFLNKVLEQLGKETLD